MTSPAESAANVLITAGIVAASGASWPIFLGRLMPTPDAQVAVSDTPGQNANPRWLLDYPTIGFIIRGPKDDYPAAVAKAKAIKDKLLGINPFDISGVGRWDGVTALGDVNFLRYDENSRPLFSLNLRIILEPVAISGDNREAL